KTCLVCSTISCTEGSSSTSNSSSTQFFGSFDLNGAGGTGHLGDFKSMHHRRQNVAQDGRRRDPRLQGDAGKDRQKARLRWVPFPSGRASQAQPASPGEGAPGAKRPIHGPRAGRESAGGLPQSARGGFLARFI